MLDEKAPATDAGHRAIASYRRLWAALALIVLGSLSVLGLVGIRIDAERPPLPEQVVSGGRTLVGPGEILDGQNVWQSLGGQEIGSVWGHGAYLAPDWTANWLHREAAFVLDRWAAEEGAATVAGLAPERQAALRERLRQVMRTNTYDASTGTLTLDAVRGAAFDALAGHYAAVFAEGVDDYAIPAGTLTDPSRQRQLAAFFFWTSWAASTERPGSAVTYTQNWPHEPLVGNTPPPGHLVWSIVSVVLLLAGIAGMVWYFAARPEPEETPA